MDHKDPYALPSPDKLQEIARKQDERAKEVKERRALRLQQKASKEQPTANEQSHAAEVIQRNYRGVSCLYDNPIGSAWHADVESCDSTEIGGL